MQCMYRFFLFFVKTEEKFHRRSHVNWQLILENSTIMSIYVSKFWQQDNLIPKKSILRQFIPKIFIPRDGLSPGTVYVQNIYPQQRFIPSDILSTRKFVPTPVTASMSGYLQIYCIVQSYSIVIDQ